MSPVGHQLRCVLLPTCDVCLRSSVSASFRFGAFDSCVCWAVGERALQRRLHVPFYVRLRRCSARRLRCFFFFFFLNARPLNANFRRLAAVIRGDFSTSRKFWCSVQGRTAFDDTPAAAGHPWNVIFVAVSHNETSQQAFFLDVAKETSVNFANIRHAELWA